MKRNIIKNVAMLFNMAFLAVATSVVFAGEQIPVNPQVAYFTLSGSIYKAVSDTGNVGDTVYVPIYFGSAGYMVSQEFKMHWKWNPDSLLYISLVKTGYNWPAGWTDSLYSSTGELKLKAINAGDSFIADSTVAMFALKFRVACLHEASGKTKIHWVPDDSADYTHFHLNYGYGFYKPEFLRDGQVVNVVTDSLEVYASRDSSIIDDTTSLPIIYWTNFRAAQGCSLRVVFEHADIQYLGYVTAGTALEGKNPTVTTLGSDTIIVKTDSSIAKGNSSTLIKFNFKNIMTGNHQSGDVTVPYAKFKGCADAYAVQTQSIFTGYIYTLYTATAEIEEESTPANTDDTLDVTLTNTFTVEMVNDSNPYYASLRIDTTWNYITYKGRINISPYYWYVASYDTGVLAGKRFTEDPGQLSQDISRSGTPSPIFRVKYRTGGTTGVSQPVKFRAAHSGQFGYLEDCRLTDTKYNSIRIYSVPNDSDLALVNGSVTIPGGGGPPGCPYLYVWDGERFIQENTILTASELSAFPAPIIDHYKITRPLAESNGRYQLQIREFEQEETYLDQAVLIQIDHSRDTKVGITPDGKIFSYDAVLQPIAAIDGEGTDVLNLVAAKDRKFFQSYEAGQVVLTFDRRTIKDKDRYCPNPQPADSTDGLPPPNKRPGMTTRLTVEIEDKDGHWESLGDVAPRANVENAFWVLGSDNIALPEQFRVKLSWDKGYSVDQLLYYLVSKEQPSYEYILPNRAMKTEEGNILNLLSNGDGLSARLIPGQVIDISFPALTPRNPDATRDFIFKAVGYYIKYDGIPVHAPSQFSLKENHPNPFNATTQIYYSLPISGNVSLVVYNIRGQKVKMLVKEYQPAGEHSVKWDGTNDSNDKVASGVYFYSLKVADYTETRKMTLLK